MNSNQTSDNSSVTSEKHPFMSFNEDRIQVNPAFFSYLETLIQPPEYPCSPPYVDLVGTSKKVRLYFCGGYNFSTHPDKDLIPMYLKLSALKKYGEIILPQQDNEKMSVWDHKLYQTQLPLIREARDCFIAEHLFEYVAFANHQNNKDNDVTDPTPSTPSTTTTSTTPTKPPTQSTACSIGDTNEYRPPFAYKTKTITKLETRWQLSVDISENLYKVLTHVFGVGGSSYGPEINGKKLPIAFQHNHKECTRLIGNNPQLWIRSHSYVLEVTIDISSEMRELVITTILAKLNELMDDPDKFEQGYKDGLYKMNPEQLPEEISKVEISWKCIPHCTTQRKVTHLFVREDLFSFIKAHSHLRGYGEYNHCKEGNRVLGLRAGYSSGVVRSFEQLNGRRRYGESGNQKNAMAPTLAMGSLFRGQIVEVPDRFEGSDQLSITEHIDLISEGMNSAAQEMISLQKSEKNTQFKDEEGWVTV